MIIVVALADSNISQNQDLMFLPCQQFVSKNLQKHYALYDLKYNVCIGYSDPASVKQVMAVARHHIISFLQTRLFWQQKFLVTQRDQNICVTVERLRELMLLIPRKVWKKVLNALIQTTSTCSRFIGNVQYILYQFPYFFRGHIFIFPYLFSNLYH